MNSALMIESEEKSKLTRKQRRIEEQDRREYVVYSFDENQGFYRSPPLNSSVSVSSLETGTSSGTVNPLTNEQKEVHETTQEVELREEQDERRNRNPTNSQDISNQDANSHSPRPPSTQRIVSQSDHPPSHSPSPLPSSAFSKSQSLKVSQNSQKKLPFRSVSLKDFRGKNRNDPAAAAGHPTSPPAEGEGHRGTSNVGYVQDRDGRLSTIQYKKNIIEINNYNEEEKKDEERMMEEDCGLMYVADE